MLETKMELPKQASEKVLLGRLKIIGWIFFLCAAVSLVYEHIPQSSDEFDYLEEEAVEELSSLNPFFVSSVFTFFGAGCLLISWKKRTSPETKDPE